MRPLSLALILAAAACLQFAPVNAADDSDWPPLEEALVRPGVRVRGGSCTSNFLFRTADNATLFLGTAAHCVQGIQPGGRIEIADGVASGTLAYRGPTGETPLDCNDFALIAIDAADRAKVHPALLYVGGPTRLLPKAAVQSGDSLVLVGNSSATIGQQVVQVRRGLATFTQDECWQFYEVLAPSVPGDSGSALMSRDGQAIAVHSGWDIPRRLNHGGHRAAPLDRALAWAETAMRQELELVTWPLLRDPFSPS